jgi:hypothetical protein
MNCTEVNRFALFFNENKEVKKYTELCHYSWECNYKGSQGKGKGKDIPVTGCGGP